MSQVNRCPAPETIRVEVYGEMKTFNTEHYIRAKTKQLRQYGYRLTEDSVRQELGKILAGKKVGVIGKFMKDEVQI